MQEQKPADEGLQDSNLGPELKEDVNGREVGSAAEVPTSAPQTEKGTADETEPADDAPKGYVAVRDAQTLGGYSLVKPGSQTRSFCPFMQPVVMQSGAQHVVNYFHCNTNCPLAALEDRVDLEHGTMHVYVVRCGRGGVVEYPVTLKEAPVQKQPAKANGKK